MSRSDVTGTSAAAQSRRALPSAREAADALRTALARGDEDRTFALALEVRDRLRAALTPHGADPTPQQPVLHGWQTCPVGLEPRWHVLLAAFVSHEFANVGLLAPAWTDEPQLDEAWVLDTPRLTDDEVRAQTPAWLRDRNIFIARKDLFTLWPRAA